MWTDLIDRPDEITRRLSELAQQYAAETVELRRRQIEALAGATRLQPLVSSGPLLTRAGRWRSRPGQRVGGAR